jgi:hypothetical protein
MTRLRRAALVLGAGAGLSCPAIAAFPGHPGIYFLDLSLFTRSEDVSPISPLLIGGAVALVMAVSFLAWTRERRLRLQRERLRKTYQLGEEVLGSSSSESILKRLSESLPGILGVSRVRLYVYNREM